MPVEIGFSPSAASTKAFAIIAEAWNDAVQEGLTPDLYGICPVTEDSKVIYAVSGSGDIVGVLVWDHLPKVNVYLVSLGYVEPSSRQQGVFSTMFKALREMAGNDGVPTIRMAFNPDTIGRDIAPKLGLEEVERTYELAVS